MLLLLLLSSHVLFLLCTHYIAWNKSFIFQPLQLTKKEIKLLLHYVLHLISQWQAMANHILASSWVGGNFFPLVAAFHLGAVYFLLIVLGKTKSMISRQWRCFVMINYLYLLIKASLSSVLSPLFTPKCFLLECILSFSSLYGTLYFPS